MTVQELIDKLSQIENKDVQVYTQGDEICDIEVRTDTKIRLVNPDRSSSIQFVDIC